MFRDAGISYSTLCLFIAMILCGIPVLSRLVQVVCFSPSVSKLSRAAAKFDATLMNRTMKRVAWSVLSRVRKAPLDWIFVVDTTSRFTRTKGVAGGGLWANSKSEIFHGQNLMVICAVNKKTGEAIPVTIAPCIKEQERKAGTTNHDLVITLLQSLIEQGWPKLNIVMDSWFDSAALMTKLMLLGFTFVIELKSKRKPKLSPGTRCPKRSLIDIFSGHKRISVRATTRENSPRKKLGWKGAKYIAEKSVWLNGVGKNTKQFRIKIEAVYNHFKEQNAFGYYATNDLSAPSTWCWKMSRYRWNIEVCFRDLKQGLRWGKWASKCPEAANLSLILPIVVLAYMRETEPEATIIGRLQRLQDEETIASVEYFANNPRSQLRENLRIRLLKSKPGKKPRITAAEKKQVGEKSKYSIKIAA